MKIDELTAEFITSKEEIIAYLNQRSLNFMQYPEKLEIVIKYQDKSMTIFEEEEFRGVFYIDHWGWNYYEHPQKLTCEILKERIDSMLNSPPLAVLEAERNNQRKADKKDEDYDDLPF